MIASDNEVIHANAADVLANITQHDSWETSQRILRIDLAKIVLLLASRSLNVQRSAPLVLGNIAQSDVNRDRIGAVGGVEALFLALSSTDDYTVRKNCLWALSNLAWNSTNQERIGRFFEELLDLCEFPDVSGALCGSQAAGVPCRWMLCGAKRWFVCLCVCCHRMASKPRRCVCWPTPCFTTLQTGAG